MEHVESSDRNKDTADNNIVLKATDFVFKEDGTQVCDHILKFESLEDDFCSLMSDPQCKLPKINASDLSQNPHRKIKHTVAELDESSIALINNVYADDFTNLGYEMLPSG